MKLEKNNCLVGRLLFVIIVLSGCAAQSNNRINLATVDRFMVAFNQHDIDAMLTETTESIGWYSVEGESITAQTLGQAQLREAMQSYFSAVPSVRSAISNISVNGNLVTVIEKATWENRGQTQQQCSKAVYELTAEKINKVWYFPAQDC